MFESSVKRFVDDYHNLNDEFRRFCRDAYLDIGSDGETCNILLNGVKVYETTRRLYLELSTPMANAIGQTTRRRHFVWYHHLIKEGVKLY